MSVRIEGARVLLPDDVVETDVIICDGLITAIGTGEAADRVIDARGLLLAPALVDVHGDAFERQLMPRPNVFFPVETAVLDTDKQLAANGIATAYHALTLSWEPGLRSVERGSSLIDAIDGLSARLLVENRIQLRWETFAHEAVDLITRALQGPLLPSIAFNDHTSMSMRDRDVPLQERLFEHNPNFRLGDPESAAFAASHQNNAKRAGLGLDDYIRMLRTVWDRRADVPGQIQHVAKLGQTAGAPMLSHDDTQLETRDFYRALGARVAEFPMRTPVAAQARELGDSIIFGAPNVVRGGSHIGSPSAADMIEDGLCDALASDYYYPAMLASVARLVDERRVPLHSAWQTVSTGPARAMNLHDRGSVTPGLRADLVLVDWPVGGTPSVTATWCAGRLAYQANGRA